MAVNIGRGYNPKKEQTIRFIRDYLGVKPLVIVGMMGCGKTCVGRRLADELGLLFHDSDWEIETAQGMKISKIFDVHGEPYFRQLEVDMIDRLLSNGTSVVATGGGAFMNARVRHLCEEKAVTVWFKAELQTLYNRIRRNKARPLMQTSDPHNTLVGLMTLRYPTYALADITIDTGNEVQDEVTEHTLNKLYDHFAHSSFDDSDFQCTRKNLA